MDRFENKVVVVSGASGGLGKALAIGFAEKKGSLGICSRDKARLAVVANHLAQLNCPCLAKAFDIREEKVVHEFVEEILSRFGRIDVVINNASLLGPRNEIASYPVHAWEEVMAINVSGAFYLTKHALKIMKVQRSGSIINVSSSVGRKGKKRWGAYAVSKFALEGLTEVLADELRETGIRVNSVNPGPIATEMRREAYPSEDQTKLKKPEEILDIFYYLASDESTHISGEKFDAQNFSVPAVHSQTGKSGETEI